MHPLLDHCETARLFRPFALLRAPRSLGLGLGAQGGGFRRQILGYGEALLTERQVVAVERNPIIAGSDRAAAANQRHSTEIDRGLLLGDKALIAAARNLRSAGVKKTRLDPAVLMIQPGQTVIEGRPPLDVRISGQLAVAEVR